MKEESSQRENPHCPEIAFVWTELDQNPFLVTIHILRRYFKDKNLYLCYWTLSLQNYVYANPLPFGLWSWGQGWSCSGRELRLFALPYYIAINSLHQLAVAQWVTHMQQSVLRVGMENEMVGWEQVIKLRWLLKIAEKWYSENLVQSWNWTFWILMTTKPLPTTSPQLEKLKTHVLLLPGWKHFFPIQKMECAAHMCKLRKASTMDKVALE